MKGNVYSVTLVINKTKAETVQRLLNQNLPDDIEDVDEAIETFTAKFDDPGKHEADIKIVGTNNGYYVDAVLFDSNGNQVGVLEPGYDFLGEYAFGCDRAVFVVTIKSSPKPFNVYKFDIEYGNGRGLTITRSIEVASSSRKEAEQRLYKALDSEHITVDCDVNDIHCEVECTTANTTYKYRGIDRNINPDTIGIL